LLIKSFKCEETELIFEGKFSKRFPSDIQRRTERKLRMLNAAEKIEDLKIPPSNNLENLLGNRKGQWSIRVNHKYRICFEWIRNEAINVEMVEYHK